VPPAANFDEEEAGKQPPHPSTAGVKRKPKAKGFVPQIFISKT